MTEVLGHEKFCAYGGDWGALITAHLAHAHADKLVGAQVALTLIPGVDRSQLTPDQFAEDEQWMIEAMLNHNPIFSAISPFIGLTHRRWGWSATPWNAARSGSDAATGAIAMATSNLSLTGPPLYQLPSTGAPAQSPVTAALLRTLQQARPPRTIGAGARGTNRLYGLSERCRSHAARARAVHSTCSAIVLCHGGYSGAAEAPIEQVDEIRAFFLDQLNARNGNG